MWVNINGNWIGRHSGKKSWITYWTHQSEVLFFGLYSEISGGRMPNKVTGATDFLTVAGVAGSETYQCPNTAAYIAADIDYIWFNMDASQRTTTTAELIGYDLQRTPVKYLDDTPNSIEAIIILSSAVIGAQRDRLFKDMCLPVLWDDNLNAFGHIKSNRLFYTPWWYNDGPGLITIDGNTVGWYDSSRSSTIIKDGSNLVSQWNDILATNNLVQETGVSQPLWSANGILFDGSNDYMKVNFSFDQPCFFYVVVKQVSWINADCIISGGLATNVGLYQSGVSPQMVIYGGGSNSATEGNLAIGNYGIVRALFNGAGSTFQVNSNAVISGSYGTTAFNGITVARTGVTAANNSNIEIKELIVRKTADEAATQTIIYNYLKSKYEL